MTIIVNGSPTTVTPGSTLAELVRGLALPDRGVALAVDGAVVRRQSWDTTILTDQARVEVVTAMQGG